MQARAFGRVLAALTGALLAALLAVSSDSLVAGWAVRSSRTGSAAERRMAVAKLGRLGEVGMSVLFALACDERTPVPLEAEGAYAMLVPRDTLADLALHEFKRLRDGPGAARDFEWDAGSGKSYGQALDEWRARERAEALRWWEARRHATARAHAFEGAMPSPGVRSGP